MKKGLAILSLLFIVSLLTSLLVPLPISAAESKWSGNAADKFSAGDGSEGSPFIIATAEELAYLAVSVNSGNNYFGKHIRLETDINLDSKNWTPVGYYANETESFNGIFDGNGHTVGGLSCVTDLKYAGLFGVLLGATVKNLSVSGVNITAAAYSGGIAGSATGGTNIINCRSAVDNISATTAGGIIGRVSKEGNTVTLCFSESVVVSQNATTNSFAGGIAGSAGDTVISFCGNYGNVSACAGTTYSVAGGIIGTQGADKLPADVNNCFNTGNISAISGGTVYLAGGIVGRGGHVAGGSVENCFNTGCASIENQTAAAAADHIGGVFGALKGNVNVISNTYSSFSPAFGENTNGQANADNCKVITEAEIKGSAAVTTMKLNSAYWMAQSADIPAINSDAILGSSPVVTETSAPETTVAPVTTKAPDTTPAQVTTKAAETTDPVTAAVTGDKGTTSGPVEKGGCGAAFASSAVLLLAGTPVFIIRKKNKDK